jgi:hypothetical protein
MFHRTVERIEVFFASLKVVTDPRRKRQRVSLIGRFFARKARLAGIPKLVRSAKMKIARGLPFFFTSAEDFPERWLGGLSCAYRPVQGFPIGDANILAPYEDRLRPFQSSTPS